MNSKVNQPRSKYLNVNEFLLKLEKELIGVPKRERDSFVMEIEEHLHDLIHEKISNGLSENEAVQQSVESFVSPKELAADLVEQYKIPKGNKQLGIFGYVLIVLSWGFVDISSALIDRGIDSVDLVIAISSVIALNIVFFTVKKWTPLKLKLLNVTTFLLLIDGPVTIIWFWLGKNKDFSTKWIISLYAYMLFMIVQFTILKVLQIKKSREVFS